MLFTIWLFFLLLFVQLCAAFVDVSPEEVLQKEATKASTENIYSEMEVRLDNTHDNILEIVIYTSMLAKLLFFGSRRFHLMELLTTRIKVLPVSNLSLVSHWTIISCRQFTFRTNCQFIQIHPHFLQCCWGTCFPTYSWHYVWI